MIFHWFFAISVSHADCPLFTSVLLSAYLCPSARVECFNQQPIEELTIAQWEEVYEGWDLEAIEQMLSQRERQICSLIVRLYYCPTKVRPLI